MSQEYELSFEEQVNPYTWVTDDLDTIDASQATDGRLYITVTHPITGDEHELTVTETDRNRETGRAIVQTDADDPRLFEVGQREPQSLYERLTRKLQLIR